MIKQLKLGTEVKKVAFVESNRAINENNVKKHVESMKKFGGNLVPMLYVDATEVKGYNFYDACTDILVSPENYKDYIVVLDGQHRYKAALSLVKEGDNNDFTLDKLRWEKVDLQENSFQNVLIEVNTITQSWRGNDYINGCVLNDPKNEVAVFAKELTKHGVSAKTINKYIFFNDKFKWSDAMKDMSMLDKANLDRAKEIWEVVQTFPEKISKRSIIIDYLLHCGGANHWEEELAKIRAISDREKDYLKKEKVSELSRCFEEMMKSHQTN